MRLHRAAGGMRSYHLYFYDFPYASMSDRRFLPNFKRVPQQQFGMPIGIMAWHRWGVVNNRCGQARKQESERNGASTGENGALLLGSANKFNQGAFPEHRDLQSQRGNCASAAPVKGVITQEGHCFIYVKEWVTMRQSRLYCHHRKIWPLSFPQPSVLWSSSPIIRKPIEMLK